MGNSNNSSDKDREAFQKAIENSENDFEQKLTYLSAGALVLSFAFIEKIVNIEKSSYLVLLIIAWGFLILTLSLNLVSHLVSKHFIVKSQNELDNELNYYVLILRIKKRNSIIDCINWISVALFLLGIVFIVTFTSINTFNMSKNNQKENEKIEIVKQDDSTGLGRTIPAPKPQNNEKPKTDNNNENKSK